MAPFRDLVEITNPGESGPEVTLIGHATAISLVAPTCLSYGMYQEERRGETFCRVTPYPTLLLSPRSSRSSVTSLDMRLMMR